VRREVHATCQHERGKELAHGYAFFSAMPTMRDTVQ
jgi:hypothetical protein